MLGRTGLIAIAATAVIAAAVFGVRALNPRELYNEMYPVEAVKRDAFHICNEADPTFVRAVREDREACYDRMPHLIAVAMGRVMPGGALARAALVDPSREAELLLILAAMPPRQPITAPRSFANTDWLRALSPPCEQKAVAPVAAADIPSGLPPSPGTGRAAALDNIVRGNLPPLPRAAQPHSLGPRTLPVISLTGDDIAPASGESRDGASFAPLPAPDIGDPGAPAIVPLAPASACGA